VPEHTRPVSHWALLEQVPPPRTSPHVEVVGLQTSCTEQSAFAPKPLVDGSTQPIPAPQVHAAVPLTPHEFAPRVSQEPPQSTPVSVPSFTPSVQLGSWHVLPGPGTAAHTPERQSVAVLQGCAATHGEQLAPPQSTPVLPSSALLLSLQVPALGSHAHWASI